MSEAAQETARNIAMSLLEGNTSPSADDLRTAIAGAAAALRAREQEVDTEHLRRRLEGEVNIYVGPSALLADNDANHLPWLATKRADIDWRFWSAYKDWQARKLPPDVITGLDRLTDRVLDNLEDPRRPGPWDRRGMLVGQVQSGKTSNYTGLIAKGADAGYNFIVVLAGLHNSLRSQTQRRLDEGFLGLDSRFSLSENRIRNIGVGGGARKHPAVQTLTSSDERGDFARPVATRVAGRLDADSPPTLLVVKKHKSILNNLYEWITSTNGELNPETGRRTISRFPLLLIDDEADNASVNTKKIEREHSEDGELLSQTDPSEINKQIRRLLLAFDRSALVSYTATPFANIFIDESDPDEQHGEDLFPRSFILRMSPPSNYVGPATVFGIPEEDAPEGEERPGLPVIRTVTDDDGWLPPARQSEGEVGPLPGSLRRAIRSFLLVCAARAARGHGAVHNSMLIHVTRYVAVQGMVRERVEAEMDLLRERVLYGHKAGDSILDELRELWVEDFEATRKQITEELRGTPIEWSDVVENLARAAGAVKVLEVNGTARDALEYADHPDGLSVIAVGGDKLSRGLTLEGLSVSYYLRASKMYDTLMQMGRWFGYRDDYTDLVRLYTTTELRDAYRDITVANEELSAKFDEMARIGSNPRQFSLYVRKSPAGLLVTAYSKMRSGRTMELTYSGEVSETIAFSRDLEVQRTNLHAVDSFLASLTSGGGLAKDDGRRHPTWCDVDGQEVVALMDEFRTMDSAKKARSKLLAEYIRTRLPIGELERWTVVMIDNQTHASKARIGGMKVGLTERAHFGAENEPGPTDDYTIRRLASPDHEYLDLSKEEIEEAEECRDEAWALAKELAVDDAVVKKPSLGPFARDVRDPSRGLLVLYALDPSKARLEGSIDAIPAFLLSFPSSRDQRTIKYVVPRRYWEQEAG